MKWIVASVAGLSCLVYLVYADEKTSPKHLSPHVLTAGKDNTLYISSATSKRLLVFDVTAEEVADRISLPCTSSGMALSADGSKLYVTAATPGGEVYVMNTQTQRVNLFTRVGHTPCSPVLSPDGGTLYICNRFNNDVSVVDVSSGRDLKRIPVEREPVAAAVHPDGSVLVVANHLPTGRSDGDFVAAAISLIDTRSGQPLDSIELPNGSTSVQGLCLSPDGRYAYVTHILGRHQLPTTQLERGWINTNAISIIDVESRTRINTVLLDNVDLGAANPWDVRCTADGRRLAITLSGTHELCLIDRKALHAKLSRAAAGEQVTSVTKTAADVPNDFSFLVGLKQRISLPGKGPRGLALIGARAFIAEYYSDSLAVVDVEAGDSPQTKSLPLQAPTPLSDIRRGEMLFHDAEICFQHWQSCASCHPGSARTDVLNWDLLNDGIGNPKNTRSLLLAHRTPPSMSLGVRDTAETAVRAGIRYIHFTVRPEADAAAIDRYLQSLTPVPSPHLVKGEPGPAALRGERVFRDAGCASCHNGPFYTDGRQYDVGTGLGPENSETFDTPTLTEVWRTAPYLHDGRAAGIHEVLTQHNSDDKHGRTSELTKEQLADLATFVLTR